MILWIDDSNTLPLVATGTYWHTRRTKSTNKETKNEAKARPETEAEQTNAPPHPHPPPSTPVLVLGFCEQFAQSNLRGPSFGGEADVLVIQCLYENV